ncbi:hypothetical protein ACFQ34_21175 [Pseudonocardia benzenivorans]|uniref:Uncharacterized protein n=2 Tax=Pseudonocardia TaxID=1847 RepID=F4CUS8_PSEUX|nr:hypothetical protein [Pseudonocardia dioxanivorans]AEA26392.1 hypothetical protein Psed_4230 [Pseudonocardia dioxanivorans CB1190]GJF03126.1 hypothetical protein PSD17_20870 [Pseudonocardia sp. D17]
MSKIALVLRELGRSQTSLLHELQALPDRHPDEHEIVHTAHDLAGWAAADLQRLGETAADTGVALRSWPRPAPLRGAVAARAARSVRHRPETGLLLLADLRRLHRKAAGVALDWTLLAQAAQAMRRAALVELAGACSPHAHQTATWARSQLVVVSPQVIAS